MPGERRTALQACVSCRSASCLQILYAVWSASAAVCVPSFVVFCLQVGFLVCLCPGLLTSQLFHLNHIEWACNFQCSVLMCIWLHMYVPSRGAVCSPCKTSPMSCLLRDETKHCNYNNLSEVVHPDRGDCEQHSYSSCRYVDSSELVSISSTCT